MKAPSDIVSAKWSVFESFTTSAVELKRRAELLSIQVSRELTLPQLTVNLSPRTRQIGWAIVLFFHIFNGLYAMAFAYLHYYMTQSKMGYYARMLGMMPPDKYLWIIVVYACISVANWYGALSMIAYSFCYRQVAFGRRTARVLAVNAAKPNASASFCIIFGNLWRPLSVRGKWFDHMLVFREIVEIGSQIYQAHSSSELVSRVWINQTFALLIFFNCITSTAVHLLKREHTGLRRLLCTAIDLALDFAWSFILPANIIFNYLPTFIRNSYSFPSSFYYSDTLFIKAMLECSQFFIVSWTDSVTTILPYLSMLSGLKNMKLLLLCDQAFGPRRSSLLKIANVVAPSHRQPPKQRASVAVNSGTGRSLNILHALVISVGIFMITVSIAASGTFTKESCPIGCKLPMHPWFSKKCGCSVLEINCYTHDIQGSADEMKAVLAAMDVRVLHYLIIAHCPALVIPKHIRDLHGLVGLQIYNSTLEAWPNEASLSFPYMPRMGYVYIARCTLSQGIPDGLTNELARNVFDIEIVASQISSIPPDLAQKWPFVMIFYLEFCGLQEFPEPMVFMTSAIDVSLVGNNISQFSSNLTRDHHWLYLSLDGNPIVELPAQLGTAQLITIQDTHVQSLSDALWGEIRSGATSLIAFNTPLCENKLVRSVIFNCLMFEYLVMTGENSQRQISRRETLNLRAAELKRKAELLARRISTPQPPPKLVVGLGRHARRLAWFTVLFFHLFNALYSMGLAYLYRYMSKPFMAYYATMLDMMAPEKYTWITVIYAAISALNWYGTLSMIFWTLYYRRLVFGRIKRRSSPSAADVEAPLASASAIAKTPKTKLSKIILHNLFHPITVRGSMFDAVLLTREMVEIASQTYQAKSSSLLVSTVWMNQVFAFLIFLNCVTGVVVHALKEDEVGQRRLLCTVIDLVLDFAWGFILPANIIFNYIPMFVSNGYSFPPSFYSSDTDFTKAVLECKQFFIISWTDAFTTILPYVNMFSGLRNMKVLLLCDFEYDKVGGPHPSKVIPGLPVSLQPPSAHEETVDENDTAEANFPYEVHADHDALTVDEGLQAANKGEGESKRQRIVLKVIHALVVGVGVFVVVTSLVASHMFDSNPCGNDCKLQMRPWFTSHCACSVQEIDCYRRKIDGNETEMSEILGTLDERVLNFLMVSHCPAMAVPRGIRRFPKLMGLQFYNASIVDWPKEAALSQPYFPRLGYVYIVRSRLDDGIPEGLTTDLASSIIDIEIIATHIGRSFPPDIADKWSSVMGLLVERCALQEFPVALAGIPSVLQFSLAYNNISWIPDQLPIVPNWQLLVLDGNPLRVLPASIDDVDSLVMLTIQDTRIEAMPPKLQARLLARTMSTAGYNTPLCKDYSDVSTSVNSSVDVEAAEAAVTKQTRVACVPMPDIFPTDGMFALAAVDALRGIP